jgi:hypothetical protein
MKRISALLLALVAVLVTATVAGAATKIDEPAASPYTVALNAQGQPVPFTVVASGFAPRTPVFVEVCNNRHPGDDNWSPSRDCDPASTNAPVYADKDGVARFDASDVNHVVPIFVGESPQQLFNCVPKGAAKPNNDLPTYTTCQLRAASSPTHATPDQTFRTIVYGSGGGTGGSSGFPVWAALLIVVLAVGGVVAVTVILRGNKTSVRVK